jgi:D-alanine-D-alanine ligase
VVFGGRSPERYDAVPIGITESGNWVLPPAGLPLTIEGGRLPAVPADATPRHPTQVLDGIDVVLPLLHGPFGEDGTLQGLLELAGVPYVGSGVFASAAAMDKHHMKQLLLAAGLPVPDYVVVRPGRSVPVDVRRLDLPVFVKPARGGSSIGITRVDDWDALDDAIAEAARHDPKVLVEAGVTGREVECGVLAGVDGHPEASIPAEILVAAGHTFYDFEAKYLDDTSFAIPPDLPAQTLDELRHMAIAAFEALDCEGLARVDFFVADADSEKPRLLVNEVNTMPGFTPSSMYPRMWAAAGVDYPTLVGRLLDDAIRRGTGLR